MSGEKRLFPSDLLDGLLACEKKVRDAVEKEPVEERDYNEMFRGLVQIFVTVLWPEFFNRKVVDTWGAGVNHPVFDSKMIELEQIYRHARKARQFKLAEEGNISVWVLPDATLEIRFGGQKLTYAMTAQNYQQQMQDVSETLLRNFEIVRGLDADPDKFIETVERINPPKEHMEKCLKDVIIQFISQLRDFDIQMINGFDFDIVEKMQRAVEDRVSPFRLTIVSGPVKVLWEYRSSLYMISGEGTDKKADKVKLADEDLANRLHALLIDHVEPLYFEIPTDSQQLYACIEAENSKDSLLEQMKRDGDK